MTYGELWWRAFWMTQAIEVPIYLLVLTKFPARPRWRSGREPDRLAAQVFLRVLASAITHPWVWYFFRMSSTTTGRWSLSPRRSPWWSKRCGFISAVCVALCYGRLSQTARALRLVFYGTDGEHAPCI